MKGNFFRIFVLVACSGLLIVSGGCATHNRPPSFAITKLENSVSVPHPDQLKESSEFITIFPLVFNPKLFVECVGTGFEGTWKVLAEDRRNPTLALKEGFAYFKKGGYEKTPWGFPLLEVVFLEKLEDSKNYRFILPNRDGMVWLFSPMGRVYSREGGYDCNKFESDLHYRNFVFQKVGMNLWEIFQAFRKLGLAEKISIGEIKIGSLEWDVFEKDLLASLPNGYQMPGGKRVVSSLDRKSFQKTSKTNSRLNGWQRLLEDINVPFPFTPEALAYGGISTLFNFGIKEAIADPIYGGNSADSTITRKETAAQFEFLVEHFNKNRQK